ncbi:hypothetical protein IFM89_012179 [Coptis chinensis]|uniref:Uncharacterized protein n=1 Tax=Coptis chinensis TaxID=261450 RepID=A0A835HBW4_9MAGN|nr:hypothetical protein IFM89_012179 [Coptis chinensis]
MGTERRRWGPNLEEGKILLTLERKKGKEVHICLLTSVRRPVLRMEKVKNLLKPKVDPREQLRDWQKRLRKECRNIERQILGKHNVKKEEKSVQKAIKEAAKRNDMGSAKLPETQAFLYAITKPLSQVKVPQRVVKFGFSYGSSDQRQFHSSSLLLGFCESIFRRSISSPLVVPEPHSVTLPD